MNPWLDDYYRKMMNARYGVNEPEESKLIEWKWWDEYVTYLLWSATETLLEHDKVFHERGLQQLNIRSVNYLESICHLLVSGKIDEEQAINFISEWLGILLAKKPEYLLAIQHVIFRLTRKHIYEYDEKVSASSIKPTDNLFINLFLDGYFFEWASVLKERRESGREGTKDMVNDYLTVRQQAKTSPNTEDKKNGKCIKCFLSEEQLESLHNQLIKAKYIESTVSFLKFNQIFNGEIAPFPEPIQWLKKTNSLGFLFYELDNNKQAIAGRWQTIIGDANKVFSVKGKVVSTSNYSSIVNNLRESLNEGKMNAEQSIIRGIVENIYTIKG
jgi:hypothetical protein